MRKEEGIGERRPNAWWINESVCSEMQVMMENDGKTITPTWGDEGEYGVLAIGGRSRQETRELIGMDVVRSNKEALAASRFGVEKRPPGVAR
jgi:hypothetical protein